ncbi:hypothetical protein Tco_1265665 [Tanacetum coccineum]
MLLNHYKKYGYNLVTSGYSHGEIVQTGWDKEGKAVDPSHYRGMINWHLSLILQPVDLTYNLLYACVTGYQGSAYRKAPKCSKKDFRICPDADLLGCQDTRRRTSGSINFWVIKLVSLDRLKRQKKRYGYPVRNQALDIGFHFIKEHVENGVIRTYLVIQNINWRTSLLKHVVRERIEFSYQQVGCGVLRGTLKQLADEVDE